MEDPQKVKNRNTLVSSNPAIPFPGTYLKEMKIGYRRDMCTSLSIALLFTTGKIQKQPQYSSVDEWIKKMWYEYAIKYYLALKKKKKSFHL